MDWRIENGQGSFHEEKRHSQDWQGDGRQDEDSEVQIQLKRNFALIRW